jgi:chemotaxis protein MotB
VEYNIDMEEEIGVASRPSRQSKGWLVIFADMVALVLTFFVLLFSMSSVKVDKWKNAIDALSQSLNPTRIEVVATPTARHNIASVFLKRAINLDYLTSVLEETVSADAALAETKIVRMEDFMIVMLPGDLLFAPGRAVLSDKAHQALFSLGGVLRNVDNEVMVNGHSDPVRPASGKKNTNWDLSLSRAVVVANALRQAGYTQEIVASGYADARYRELPDLPERERRVLGRRVDILIMPTVAGDR